MKVGVKTGTVALVLCGIWLSGCAGLQSVSMTRVPKDRSRPVEAEDSSFALFGIHLSTGWVDEVMESLRKQCPDGKVSGVFTKYWHRYYFLADVRSVRATGFCQMSEGRVADNSL